MTLAAAHDAFIVHHARIVGAGPEGLGDHLEGWVAVRGERIVGVGSGNSLAQAISDAPDAQLIDAREHAGPDALLSPGLIDIHLHGGGGGAVDDAAGIVTALDTHLAHGVTRVVASLVSAPEADLTEQLRQIAEAMQQYPGLLGAHLEGPCLDPGHRGAHDPEALAEPNAELFARLLEAGPIRQVTLAPELPGAQEAIAALRKAGVVVAVGHTDADIGAAATAFDAGATLVTHAFNAMHGLHHRAPGPVGAGLADGRVSLEVIADGVHVAPVVVRTLFAAAPERVVLVSDAMAAAGAADGLYTLGSLEVEVADGKAVLASTDTIAGSTLTLDIAVRNAVAWGIPLAQAVRAATVVPARVLGIDELGRLRSGCRADLVLWSADCAPVTVWRDGEVIAGAAAV